MVSGKHWGSKRGDIIQKGNVENPWNYRPTSLLQSKYKIYAGMIKNREADAIDERIWKLHFGFQGKKSTAQAMFICRRLQGIIERSNGEPLTMIFLDWEKAFDKINQEKLFEALERVGIPNDLLNLIKNIYNRSCA